MTIKAAQTDVTSELDAHVQALMEAGSSIAHERDRYREALFLIASRDYGAIEDKQTAARALFPNQP